jgi:N utilization substance protein B
MASRHLSRALVLQTLFESDMTGVLDRVDEPAKILKRNSKEFALGASDMAFAESLLKGILAKRTEVDAVTIKAAPQWPLDKIAPIDRNVLRIGLYELLFGDRTSVPPKVALNEAIEVAKSFGGEQSGKFVNGVLGAVYREIGEPQKADAPKPEVLPGEALAGAVVVAGKGSTRTVALVHDAFHRWALPKTKLKQGELTATAAARAIQNELGISATIVAPLGEHTYRANDPAGMVERTVSFFLAKADDATPLTCTVCDGIDEARWFTVAELAQTPMYDDLRGIIAEALKHDSL